MSCREKQSEKSIVLLELPELIKGTVTKRPSKEIKSPYVADIKLDNHDNEILGHSASLGCCGLCEIGSNVLLIESNGKTKCSHKVMLSVIKEKGHTITIGIYPKLAEKITYNALLYNCIDGLKAKSIATERKILNSRFDFFGKDENGDYYVLEVKNVPLADYIDIETKYRKKMNFDDRKWNDKLAYFPDGYRKSKKAPVSERAVKHIRELQEIKMKNKSIRTILLFVIQREDVSSFCVSKLDKIYLDSVREARDCGVEIKTLQVVWRENKCYFIRNDLPIVL